MKDFEKTQRRIEKVAAFIMALCVGSLVFLAVLGAIALIAWVF